MKIQTKLDLHSIPYDFISGHIYIKHDGVEYFAQPQSKYLTKHLKSASGPRMLDVSPNGLLVPIVDDGIDAYLWAELQDIRKFGK